MNLWLQTILKQMPNTYVSFDSESLFTNVLSGKSFEIILIRVSSKKKTLKALNKRSFNPIKNRHFHRRVKGEGIGKTPLAKICQTYPKLMKLVTVVPCLKKIQKLYKSCITNHVLIIKYINHDFCWHQHFSTEISNIYYRNKYR